MKSGAGLLLVRALRDARQGLRKQSLSSLECLQLEDGTTSESSLFFNELNCRCLIWRV